MIRDDIVALLPDLRAFSRFLCRERESADDLVQNTILSALDKQDQFEPGTNLKGWLFTIMRNRFYSDLRTQRRRPASIDSDTAPMLTAVDNPEATLALKELSSALFDLSPQSREALVLVGAGGFSYEEAAALCGCSVGTLKARVSRARKQLSGKARINISVFNGLAAACNLLVSPALVQRSEFLERFMANETSNDIRDFHEQLKAILPRLRIYALSLTRDRDAADDLVHDTVIKALTGRHSFQPGTNLAAWLFRIQRNEFISGLRRQRPTVPVDTAIAESLSHPAHQDSGLVMREFVSAFAKLAPTQREALLLAVLEGLPYEVIAQHTGVSVGTVKSRISRARDTLERLLLEGETKPRPTSGIDTTADRDADEAQHEQQR